jgi:NAD(P)-dependent dehydrogenase (short-subunit alcohol dehydrogenase family)
MAKNGGGRMVVITSVDGQIVVPGEGHYGASKAALMHLCRIAAVELIQHGIYVNSIAPGWVYTDLTKHELDVPEKRAYWQGNIPAHRVASIDEIAQAALFLARDDQSEFIVGASLVIDGGASLVMKGF